VANEAFYTQPGTISCSEFMVALMVHGAFFSLVVKIIADIAVDY